MSLHHSFIDNTKKNYKNRVDSVTQMLHKLKDLLLKDDLLKTLKNDGISKEFVNIRIHEIVESFLNNDREILLKRTFEKYEKLKQKNLEVNFLWILLK